MDTARRSRNPTQTASFYAEVAEGCAEERGDGFLCGLRENLRVLCVKKSSRDCRKHADRRAKSAEQQLPFFVFLVFPRGQFFARKTKTCRIVVRMDAA